MSGAGVAARGSSRRGAWGAQAWQPAGDRVGQRRTPRHRPDGLPPPVRHRRRRSRCGSGRRDSSGASPGCRTAQACPMPYTWDGRGRVIWWLWPNSSSIAADGVAVYANAAKIASGLMFSDYVSVCGSPSRTRGRRRPQHDARQVDRLRRAGRLARRRAARGSRRRATPRASSSQQPTPTTRRGHGAASTGRSGSSCRRRGD